MTVWAVLLAAATGLLAVWGFRRARDASGYFAASRTAGPILAGLGGTAAGLSAFVFIGGPGLFASIGVASLWIILSAPLTGALQCWAVGEPVARIARLRSTLTVPGILAARYGEGAPRGLAAAAVIAGGIAMLAVQVKGVAVAGDVLLGGRGWTLAAVLVGGTTLYTAAGGMRAGLLAEGFQGLLMAVAALVLAWVALDRAGGPAAALHTLHDLRPALLDPWNGIGPSTALGWFLLFGLGTCAQPHYLQKFLLVRSEETLRWMPLVMTGGLLAVLTVWIGVGLGGTALVARGDLRISTPDQLAPALLLSLSPTLLLVATAAVAAAVMSTAATLLNLVAAAVARDLPLATGHAPGESLVLPRLATVGAAGLAMALAAGSGRSVALLGVLGWGTFTAALLPAILLGLNWERASRRGAVAAMIAGPSVQLLMEGLHRAGMAKNLEPGLAGAAAGTLILIALSYAEHREEKTVWTTTEVSP